MARAPAPNPIPGVRTPAPHVFRASTAPLPEGLATIDWLPGRCDGPRMGTRWTAALPRAFTDSHPAAWLPTFEASLAERTDATSTTLQVLHLPKVADPPTS